MQAILVILLAYGAIACNTSPFALSSDEEDQETANSIAEVDASKIRFRFGLRNFREINAIMHSKTVASVAEQDVQASHGQLMASAATSCKRKHGHHGKGYTLVGKGAVNQLWCSGVKDLLPKSSHILSLTASTQVGIFKLASAYCQQLMQDNDNGKQARVQKLPTVAAQLNDIKMSQRPATIDTSLQNSIAAAFVNHFHGTQTVRPEAATTQSDLATLMANLISTQEEKGHKQASNQEVLMGACSAALASAQMVFH